MTTSLVYTAKWEASMAAHESERLPRTFLARHCVIDIASAHRGRVSQSGLLNHEFTSLALCRAFTLLHTHFGSCNRVYETALTIISHLRP